MSIDPQTSEEGRERRGGTRRAANRARPVTPCPRPEGPRPEDELVWSLRRAQVSDCPVDSSKAARSDNWFAVCVLRPHPLGIDLRASVGGETMYTKVHRSRERALGDADGLRKRLALRGWF